eukprot:637795-Prorocentrum_minimum.AAC.3
MTPSSPPNVGAGADFKRPRGRAGALHGHGHSSVYSSSSSSSSSSGSGNNRFCYCFFYDALTRNVPKLLLGKRCYVDCGRRVVEVVEVAASGRTVVNSRNKDVCIEYSSSSRRSRPTPGNPGRGTHFQIRLLRTESQNLA